MCTSAGDTSAAVAVPDLFKNREPGGILAPKSRPLVAKLELLLELLARRVVFDASEGAGADWTQERVVRTLKKQDHDLGS